MSSETLNFGPQWLRELSSGEAKTSSEPSPSNLFPPASKFKLADYRYGREEMLALFTKENEIPEELFRIPLLISEEPLLPLAFTPTEDLSLLPQQNGYRGRGISPGNMRSRPMPSRGIGRNRGASWDQNDDFFSNRPPLRRAESEDWRSNYVNGKGDGDGLVEKNFSRKDWRSGPRKEIWKENYSVFHDSPEEIPESNDKRVEKNVKENQNISPTAVKDSNENINPTESNKEMSRKDVARSNNSKFQDTGGDKTMEIVTENLLIRSQTETPSTIHSVSENQALPQDNVSTLSQKTHLQLSLSSSWFYKDPQGVTQGPFSSSQMMEWFNAGYFTLVLLVRRGCDETFTPLGQLIKMHSCVPFQEIPTKPNELSTTGNENTSQDYSYLQDRVRWGFPTKMQGPDGTASEQNRFMQDSIAMSFNNQNTTTLGLHNESMMRTLQKRQLEEAQLQKLLLQDQNYEKLIREQNILHFMQKDREKLHQQEALLQKQREWEHLEKQKILNKELEEKERQEKIKMQKEEEQQNAFKEMMRIQREKEEMEKQEEFRRKKQMEEIELQEKLKKMFEEQKRKEEMEQQERMEKFIEEQRQREKLKEEERLKKILEEQKRREELEEQERVKKMLEEQKRKEELEKQEKINEMLKKELERQKERTEQELLQKQREMDELARKVGIEQKVMNDVDTKDLEQTTEESPLSQEEGEWKKYENVAKAQKDMNGKGKKKKGKAEETKKLSNSKNSGKSTNMKKENQQSKQQNTASANNSASIKNVTKKPQEVGSQTQKSKETKQSVEPILPPSAQWVVKSTKNQAKSLPSLMEIQSEEKAHQARLMEEEAKMERNKQKKQPVKKSGWSSTLAATETKSLLEIQKEEKRQLALVKEKPAPRVQVPETVKDSLWSKPPKIQPDPVKSNFWDQVLEETAPKPKQSPLPKSSRPQKVNNKLKNIKNEEEKVKSIFQSQPSTQKSSFTEWCQIYLKGMNTGHLDIPTFVSFLVDVQSSTEVEEYVQSYLGDSRDAKEFLRLFLEKRVKGSSVASFTRQSSSASEFEGFELVSGNSKRSKKKQKKSQKLDPRLLGFSVNAASDRVNMGEIETTQD